MTGLPDNTVEYYNTTDSTTTAARMLISDYYYSVNVEAWTLCSISLAACHLIGSSTTWSSDHKCIDRTKNE